MSKYTVVFDIKPVKRTNPGAGRKRELFPFETGDMPVDSAFELPTKHIRRIVTSVAKKWREEHNPSFRYKTQTHPDGRVWFFRLADEG